jgi:polyhydroxyalkanoate synthase
VARPALVFCGQGDTIAPPTLAEPLAAAIPGARLLRPRTGHVGMVVGSAARAEVWRPLAEFVRTHAG